MEEKLEDLGLTRNEARIYLFLLRNGETTTGKIIKNTSIITPTGTKTWFPKPEHS